MRIIKSTLKWKSYQKNNEKIEEKTILFLNIRVEMVSLQLKQARSAPSAILNSNQEKQSPFTTSNTERHLSRQMFVRKLLIFSLLFLLSNLKYI